MNIKLIKMVIKNFKGIKDFAVNFTDNTTIKGPNGSGKTSLNDAYLWNLFGKDSQDRKDFEIQPLDANNNPIHNIETQVDITLSIDGEESVFTRLYKESWVKHRGQVEPELKGHTTEYYIDEVPQKQKDFNAKVDSLMSSELFKLVSNPNYFASLDWKKQREIVIAVTGNVEDSDVINYNDKLKKLGELLGKSSVEGFKLKTKAQIKKLKQDKDGIPARIDECNSQKTNLDWAALEIQKKVLTNKVKDIDGQIADSSKANEEKLKLQEELNNKKSNLFTKIAEVKSEAQTELFNAKAEYNKKESESKANFRKPLMDIQGKLNGVTEKLNEVNGKINYVNYNISSCNNNIESYTSRAAREDKEEKELINQYCAVKKSTFTFDESRGHCPTCGRDYDNIEEIKAHAEEVFNKDKEGKLDVLMDQGKTKLAAVKESKAYIEEYQDKKAKLEEELKPLTDERDKLKEEYNNLAAAEKVEEVKTFSFSDPDLEAEIEAKEKFIDNPYFIGQEELKQSIQDLQAKIDAYKSPDNSSLVAEKESLQSQIDDITKQLAKKDNNIQLDKRIKELTQQEKDIAVNIAQLEGYDFLTEEFTRTKVELLEGKINSKFKTIKFKLFAEQVNGSLVDTCSILCGGVPYKDANTASKINAGLEVINTLSEHYGVASPVFIDNRESVNEIVPINSQVINLVVSKDESLVVEG